MESNMPPTQTPLPAVSGPLPSVPEEKTPLTDEKTSDPVFAPVCKDVLEVLSLYKQLVKRVEHNVEEMESILKVYRDLEAVTKGVTETSKLSVSKSVYVNFLVAYKILVKRAKFEIEELEVFGKPFRVLNELQPQ